MSMEESRQPVLQLEDVSYSFRTYGGVVKAVRNVSFDLKKGEILGIVGESGCGKSVTTQCIMRLNPEPPGFFEGGRVLYKGEDIVQKSEKQMRAIRGREIGFIFQDPMTSLNPTMRIGNQIKELLPRSMSRDEKKKKVIETLSLVGISDAERRYRQYPHELSGGMKQRVMIAIALIGNPEIIIADEPTTSLDVTIEAQILDTLRELRDKLNTSIIIITHDLGVIARLCDRVLVMYGGKIIERGSTDEIFYETRHPYTAGLMRSIARLDMSRDEKLVPIEGTPPDLFSPPQGCPFAARCEYAMQICSELPPETTRLSEGHETCCWLERENAPSVELVRKGGVSV